MSDERDPGGLSQNAEAPTVPFECLPDPMLQYSFDRDTPVVTATNPSFSGMFETAAEGLPITEWCRREGLDGVTHSLEEVPSAIHNGAAIELTDRTAGEGSEGVRYRVDPVTNRSGGGFLHISTIEVADDEVDRIASVISHDLRNPLDVAKARLRAARETGDPEHFEHLEKAHDRMERIIQDVLTLARGAGAINPEDGVAIERIATEAWTTVETEDGELVVADDLPVTEADPDRLQRLFENLFRNSLEHGRRSRADEADGVRIRVGRMDDGFVVVDDGPGIPPEDRTVVFEPGYSSEENGTGLGLTIVERIAEAHGWRITLTSGEAGGARFEFHGLETTATSA